MDPKSKLLSAIAIATVTASFAGSANAQSSLSGSQAQLYEQCFDTTRSNEERADLCSCFLQSFPDSNLASTVLSEALALRGDQDPLPGSSSESCGDSIVALNSPRFESDRVEIY